MKQWLWQQRSYPLMTAKIIWCRETHENAQLSCGQTVPNTKVEAIMVDMLQGSLYPGIVISYEKINAS